MRHQLILSFLGAAALLSASCTLQFVDGGAPAPRHPRAGSIQDRAYSQIDSIEFAVRRGDLDEDIADALADNDDSVLELTHTFQHSFSPPRDLTKAEWNFLSGMLDDNETLLEDAIRRRQAWRWFFNRGFSSYPASWEDRRIYEVHLHYQIKRQYYEIERGQRSGRLTPGAAQELRGRVASIRNRRLDSLRRGEKLTLGQEEVRELKTMVEDNSRLLQSRSEGSERTWKEDRSQGWEKRESAQKEYFTGDRWRNDHHRPDRGMKKGWRGLEDEDVPAPTPIPALRPSPTPLPDLREADEEEVEVRPRGKDRKKDLRRGEERDKVRRDRDLRKGKPTPTVTPEASEGEEEGKGRGRKRGHPREEGER